MLNPGAVLDTVVSVYRDIPALMAELDNNITGFRGQWSDRFDAIYKMARPGALVIYEGFGPGNSREGIMWSHRVTIAVRLPKAAAAATEATYLNALHLLVEGVPTAHGIRALNAQFSADLLPMDVPTCERRMFEAADGTLVEYYEFSTAFPEVHDA